MLHTIMMTDEQKKLVGEAFDELDYTRQGFIPATSDTLLEAARMAGLNPTERDMQQKLQEINLGDTISRADLLDLLCQFEWPGADEARGRLRADLAMFDSRRSGALNALEVRNILTCEGPEAFPEDSVDEIIGKFVKEPDGQYNIDNLVTTLLSSSR